MTPPTLPAALAFAVLSLPDVLAHHEGTIRVTHRLRPFAVAMAGSDEFDPWKD